MKISSPMPTGNGAYIVHEQLSFCIDSYSLIPYNPKFTLFPPVLPLLNGKRTDIVHTTPDYGIFFKKRNTRLVLTFHNYVLDQFMQGYSSFMQKLHYKTDLKYFTRLSVKQADFLTAVSHFTADLVKLDMGLNRDVRVIYNGIDESLFVPAKSKKKDSSITVLFSGNTSRRKGFDFIPKLLPFLNSNIKILYTTGLRNRRPAILADKLVDIGSIHHQDMPAHYQKADILISPSIREGFGLSVAEAMSCGLPVVAFNTSSLPELIDHGVGGYLTDINDVKRFAEYLNKLGESSSLRDEMGDYNRAKVEKMFTRRRMVKEYEDLFEECCSL